MSYEDIELYYKLNCSLNCGLDDVGGRASQSGLCRQVNRFGLDYEDCCKFPLVLPVFSGEDLHAGQRITWNRIMVQADACLALWEHSAINNLR